MEMGSRFLNELLPWGDAKKGMWAGKRDAMVVKYMEKTGESNGTYGDDIRRLQRKCFFLWQGLLFMSAKISFMIGFVHTKVFRKSRLSGR